MSHWRSASHISFEFVLPQDKLCYMPYIAGMASRLSMEQWKESNGGFHFDKFLKHEIDNDDCVLPMTR